MDRRRILLVVAAVVAALGLVLVLVYARSADTRAAEDYDTVTTLKAIEPIALGETFDDALAAGKVEEQRVPRGQLLDGYVTDAATLDGQLAAMDIAVGEQITTAKFAEEVRTGVVLPVPAGMLGQSVQLDDQGRVAGFASPGDSVAVLVASAENQAALVLVPETQILAVGSSSPIATSTTEEGAETTDAVANTVVTLALTPEGALDLTAAIDAGATITLAIRGEGVELERGQTLSEDAALSP
ncbi:Flp pilus assembly protein CpaB [Nocardioides alkalitolerans]|uniref:Flp pilus assembly protein CpaB n=1 Tax=Nocardioides alkalitolerans TaxID=281714 RepID=UPI0003F97F7A|nr:Flp pilus assembly protein CpaB [Nocardioides alkalitolerans]